MNKGYEMGSQCQICRGIVGGQSCKCYKSVPNVYTEYEQRLIDCALSQYRKELVEEIEKLRNRKWVSSNPYIIEKVHGNKKKGIVYTTMYDNQKGIIKEVPAKPNTWYLKALEDVISLIQKEEKW